MELSTLLGTSVAVGPMPQEYVDRPPSQAIARDRSRLPRVTILGGTRREKGSHRIPEIIRACRDVVPVEFLVHLTNDTLTAEESATLARIADEPNVVVIREALPREAYHLSLIHI